MPAKADRVKVPKFGTESEEAKWWDDHKDMVEENLIQAMRDGMVQRGTAARSAGGAHSKKRHYPGELAGY